VRIEFTDQEEVVTASPNRLADDSLRAALTVHLGAIDETHAEIQRSANDVDLSLEVVRVFAHAPGTETERRHGIARGKRHLSHNLNVSWPGW
jgi:hypothetical protein